MCMEKKDAAAAFSQHSILVLELVCLSTSPYVQVCESSPI